MNEHIGRADGVLLICSKTSAKSKFVNSEGMAAMAADKLVIPIFIDKGDRLRFTGKIGSAEGRPEIRERLKNPREKVDYGQSEPYYVRQCLKGERKKKC